MLSVRTIITTMPKGSSYAPVIINAYLAVENHSLSLLHTHTHTHTYIYKGDCLSYKIHVRSPNNNGFLETIIVIHGYQWSHIKLF